MIELNKIYQEDCMHFMNRMVSDGKSVDVIVTSPPYNLNKKYQKLHRQKGKKRIPLLAFRNCKNKL